MFPRPPLSDQISCSTRLPPESGFFQLERSIQAWASSASPAVKPIASPFLLFTSMLIISPVFPFVEAGEISVD